MRRQKVGKPKVDGINVHGFGHLIQSNLNGASRVDGAVATHGARCWFVGPDASTGVVERTEFVRCCGQHTVVVGRDVAEGSKTTAVDEGVDVETRNPTFGIGGHFHIDVAWVPSTVDPIDLFSVKGDANGPAGFPCKNSGAHLVRERVGFAAETAADKGANHVDLVHGDVEDGRESTVRIVRHLLRRVELEPPVRVPVGHDSVGFGEPVVDTQHRPGTMGRGVRRVHEGAVAEFLEDTLLNVGASQVVLASPVDGFVMVFQPLFGVKHRFEFFPFNVEQRQGFDGRGFVDRRYARHQVANVSDLLDGHGVLVFGHRENAKSIGRILTGGHGHDTGEGFDPRSVDGFDTSVVMGGAQNFTDEFAGQADVVTVPCLAGDLGVGIHQRNGFSNNCPRSVAVVNVVASGFRLFAAHGFGDEIKVAGAHRGFASAGTRWRKHLLSCDALAVFANLR